MRIDEQDETKDERDDALRSGFRSGDGAGFRIGESRCGDRFGELQDDGTNSAAKE